jgi:hypothetical protein
MVDSRGTRRIPSGVRARVRETTSKKNKERKRVRRRHRFVFAIDPVRVKRAEIGGLRVRHKIYI